jgi:hypothetical protein
LRAEGEVVWAHLDGDRGGEIGLAFVSLDPRTELAIEQMIVGAEPEDAPNAPSEVATEAEPQAFAAPREPVAKVARLALEGIDEPLAARIARREDGRAVFEQLLPLLELGRGVRTDAPGLDGRRGAIAGVELRMMGQVPTLAVTVEFEDHSAYGEFHWSTAGEQDAGAPEGDTARDLVAPEVRAAASALPDAPNAPNAPIAADPHKTAPSSARRSGARGSLACTHRFRRPSIARSPAFRAACSSPMSRRLRCTSTSTAAG